MIRVVASFAFLLFVIGYAAPSVIAIWRAHDRWPLVVAINVLLGWTLVGWFAALAVALELTLPKPTRKPMTRAKPAPADDPLATSAATLNEVASLDQADPPAVFEEAYARWLDGGAAMTI